MGARKTLAAVVGWTIVAIVVYLLLGALVASIGFVLRTLIWVVLLGAMITLYLGLRAPGD
jgi:hypothetical protein